MASSLDGGSGRSSRASTPDELTPSLAPVRAATRQELCVSCIAAAAAAAALANSQSQPESHQNSVPVVKVVPQDIQELHDPPVQQVLQPAEDYSQDSRS